MRAKRRIEVNADRIQVTQGSAECVMMRGALTLKVEIDAIVKRLLRQRQLIPTVKIGGGELIKHRRCTAGR